MNLTDKVSAILLMLMVSAFAVSYGGDAFPNQSQITNGWFINTTHFYPYPMVFNQTNETDIGVNSSYPFNISFKFQLNNREGEVKNLNITSPQLQCTDYNNDMTYGNYSNLTINDWVCNGTNFQAGYHVLQFEVAEFVQNPNTQLVLTGTYLAEVAQPKDAPLAYAPDHALGSTNASNYGLGYAMAPTIGTTPATTIKAMQQLQEKEQKQNVSSAAIVPPQTTMPKQSPPINNSHSAALPDNTITTPASTAPVPVAMAAPPPLQPIAIPNDVGAPAPPPDNSIPWWALLMLFFALFAWAGVAAAYLWLTRKKEPPKKKEEPPAKWTPDYREAAPLGSDMDIILSAAEKKGD